MKRARIYVDGKGYQGEDLEREEVRQPGLSSGWRTNNMGALDALKFGDEAMVITSETSIRSHLERIFTRLRNKTLDASRIVIELEDYMP